MLGLVLGFILGATGTAPAAVALRVLVDGTPIHSDFPFELVPGSVVGPVRAVAAALGARVSWDGANQSVRLNTGIWDDPIDGFNSKAHEAVALVARYGADLLSRQSDQIAAYVTKAALDPAAPGWAERPFRQSNGDKLVVRFDARDVRLVGDAAEVATRFYIVTGSSSEVGGTYLDVVIRVVWETVNDRRLPLIDSVEEVGWGIVSEIF